MGSSPAQLLPPFATGATEAAERWARMKADGGRCGCGRGSSDMVCWAASAQRGPNTILNLKSGCARASVAERVDGRFVFSGGQVLTEGYGPLDGRLGPIEEDRRQAGAQVADDAPVVRRQDLSAGWD